jgi:hypothetical protein
MDLLREEREHGKKEVHIGFSGGHTIRKTFQAFADLLCTLSDDETHSAYSLPDRIKCHALVAGFDTGAPGTDPTSFFVYLSDQLARAAIKCEFVLFHAPPVIAPPQYDQLLELPALKESKEASKDLDIIVTSAALFSDEHSQLRLYFKKFNQTMIDRLNENCVGDMLWLPLTKDGNPIDLSDYPLRLVNLVGLEELPHRIERGLKVLLALGPCAAPQVRPTCPRKTGVLKALLSSNHRYFSHLVIDRRTANELLVGSDDVSSAIADG